MKFCYMMEKNNRRRHLLAKNGLAAKRLNHFSLINAKNFQTKWLVKRAILFENCDFGINFTFFGVQDHYDT